MTTGQTTQDGLTEEDLNELDEWILDFLSEHEWATPNLIRKRYGEENGGVSRQWVSDRITRLREHGCLARVHVDASEYRLVVDPRVE